MHILNRFKRLTRSSMLAGIGSLASIAGLFLFFVSAERKDPPDTVSIGEQTQTFDNVGDVTIIYGSSNNAIDPPKRVPLQKEFDFEKSGQEDLCERGIPSNFAAPPNAVSEGSCIELCDGILLTVSAVYVDDSGNAGNEVSVTWSGTASGEEILATNAPAYTLYNGCKVRLVKTGKALDRRYAVFHETRM